MHTVRSFRARSASIIAAGALLASLVGAPAALAAPPTGTCPPGRLTEVTIDQLEKLYPMLVGSLEAADKNGNLVLCYFPIPQAHAIQVLDDHFPAR